MNAKETPLNGSRNHQVNPRDGFGVDRDSDHEGECGEDGLAGLDDASAVKPVREGASEHRQAKHRERVGCGDHAQERGRASDVVDQVAPSQHLHLHASHDAKHAEPHESEIPVGQRPERVAPACHGR
jgi:hypothetical protein